MRRKRCARPGVKRVHKQKQIDEQIAAETRKTQATVGTAEKKGEEARRWSDAVVSPGGRVLSGSDGGGINPAKFGSAAWTLIFAAGALADQHSDVGASGVREVAIDFVRLCCDILPCSHCRASSRFLDHERPSWWDRVPLVQFMFWLRLTVNRKLMQQELELASPARGSDCAVNSPECSECSEPREQTFAKWRRYVPDYARIRPARPDTAVGVRALLTLVWWSCHSNVTRPRVCRFVRHYAMFMYRAKLDSFAEALHALAASLHPILCIDDESSVGAHAGVGDADGCVRHSVSVPSGYSSSCTELVAFECVRLDARSAVWNQLSCALQQWVREWVLVQVFGEDDSTKHCVDQYCVWRSRSRTDRDVDGDVDGDKLAEKLTWVTPFAS